MGFKNYICKKASKSITIPGKGFIKLRNVSSDLNYYMIRKTRGPWAISLT